MALQPFQAGFDFVNDVFTNPGGRETKYMLWKTLTFCAVALLGAMGLSNSVAGGEGGGGPPPPITVYDSNSETMVGIGLRFEFGDMRPAIVGTVRHTKTNEKNNVVGALGEVSFPLLGDQPFVPTVRAKGLVGNTDVQGLAGFGFNFAEGQALVNAGIQGPHVEGGLDVLLNGEINPYIGVNTFNGAPKRDKKTIIPLPPPPPPPVD